MQDRYKSNGGVWVDREKQCLISSRIHFKITGCGRQRETRRVLRFS